MLNHRSMLVLLAKALKGGAIQRSPTRFEWDVFGNCKNPYTRTAYSRPEPKAKRGMIFIGPGTARPLELVITMRCRRCETCRRARSRMWTQRAKFEVGQSQRTWFGTLTLSPQSHFLMETRARAKAYASVSELDLNGPEALFYAEHSEISSEITKFLKRVRKQSGADMRYLFVAEQHSSGLPHYHALIHEKMHSKPVTKSVLEGQWPFGFSKWRLMKHNGEAAYVCKYLTKELSVRIRASVRYGEELKSEIASAASVDIPFSSEKEIRPSKTNTSFF